MTQNGGYIVSHMVDTQVWETYVPSDNNEVIEWIGLGNIPSPYQTVNEILSTALTNKKNAVDKLCNSKIYTDTPAIFPSGIKNIQFRDQNDELNFTISIMDATINVVNGLPLTNVIYRTSDNITQTLTSAQLVTIGQTIKANKLAIKQAAWVHKDALSLLNTKELIDSYDITTGWPI